MDAIYLTLKLLALTFAVIRLSLTRGKFFVHISKGRKYNRPALYNKS